MRIKYNKELFSSVITASYYYSQQTMFGRTPILAFPLKGGGNLRLSLSNFDVKLLAVWVWLERLRLNHALLNEYVLAYQLLPLLLESLDLLAGGR